MTDSVCSGVAGVSACGDRGRNRSGCRFGPKTRAKGNVMAQTSNGRTAAKITFLPAGLGREQSEQLVEILQGRLIALLDLGLTIKHVHWNVVGPHFIGVHQMLDPQAVRVGEIVDELAERITTLGGSPNGLAGAIVAQRSWDDYALGRDLRRRASRSARSRLRRRDHVASRGDRRDRADRPGDPGHADRADRGARALPLVRARTHRGFGRQARDRGHAHGARGSGELSSQGSCLIEITRFGDRACVAPSLHDATS